MSNTANKPNYRFNNQDQIQSKDNKENGRVARTMTNHHPYLLKPSQQRDKTSLIPKIPRNKHIRQQQQQQPHHKLHNLHIKLLIKMIYFHL